MRDSYVEREVPTGVEEDHDDVNKTDILVFTDDDIESFRCITQRI
jgi:hypothetical protein